MDGTKTRKAVIEMESCIDFHKSLAENPHKMRSVVLQYVLFLRLLLVEKPSIARALQPTWITLSTPQESRYPE
jgi:hypothetical protein